MHIIIVNGVEYVKKETGHEETGHEDPIQIVVLDRGFVYIGRVKVEGDFVVIRSAKNIRQWGTARGLGELVNGPLSATKLDAAGTVRAPLRALISLIDVEQAKWNSI